MTYEEVVNIASRLSKATKKRIDKDVDERMEILREGNLSEEDMAKMEECLYMSLVIQEYLDGEFELLEEEKALLLDEMEELYNEYGDLLTRAKLEEKLSKKKRMALELMRIREQLYGRKELLKNVNENLKSNKKNKEKLNDLSSKDTMKEVAKDSKKDVSKLNVESKGNDKENINTQKHKERPSKNSKIDNEKTMKKEQTENKTVSEKKTEKKEEEKKKNTDITLGQNVLEEYGKAINEITKTTVLPENVKEQVETVQTLANQLNL